MNIQKKAKRLVKQIRKEAKREAEVEMVAKLVYNNEALRETAKNVLGLYPFLDQREVWYLMLEEIVCSLDELKNHQNDAYGDLNAMERVNTALGIRHALGIDCPGLIPYNFD